METNDRIIEFIKHKGLSINAFEKSIGKSNNYIRNSKSFTANVLAKIIEVYPELSIGWLITGRGEMLKTERTPDADNAALAGILAAIRDRYNLTDAEIAEKIGVNLQYMLDSASGKLSASERLRKILTETFPDLNQREAETTSPDTAALLELLKNQSIQLTKCQEQIDRLINIIEKFNTK